MTPNFKNLLLLNMVQLIHTPLQETSAIAIAVSTFDIINLWLHGKSQHSQRAYRRDVLDFFTWCGGKDLDKITLNDLQQFVNALGYQGYKQATITRKMAALKSLFSFAQKTGLIKINPCIVLKLQTPKNILPERILSQSQVLTMIALTENERDRLLIKFLYATGVRVSEACNLKWRDVQSRDNGTAQVNVFGKGSKSRVVLISAEMWRELQQLKGSYNLSDPVFRSLKKGHLDPSQVNRIVKNAAKRAKIEGNVSPHWLRHSHASHCLEKGAPIQLVQKSLGHSQITTTERYLHARPNDSSGLYLGI
jgi:site-specific recombinase XerD